MLRGKNIVMGMVDDDMTPRLSPLEEIALAKEEFHFDGKTLIVRWRGTSNRVYNPFCVYSAAKEFWVEDKEVIRYSFPFVEGNDAIGWPLTLQNGWTMEAEARNHVNGIIGQMRDI